MLRSGPDSQQGKMMLLWTSAQVQSLRMRATEDKIHFSKLYMLHFAFTGVFVCYKVTTNNQAVTPECLFILMFDSTVDLALHV